MRPCEKGWYALTVSSYVTSDFHILHKFHVLARIVDLLVDPPSRTSLLAGRQLSHRDTFCGVATDDRGPPSSGALSLSSPSAQTQATRRQARTFSAAVDVPVVSETRGKPRGEASCA